MSNKSAFWLVFALPLSVFISIIAFAAITHESRFERYIQSDGYIYTWIHYSCDGGVMYRRGRSYTLMVDSLGNPMLCKEVSMTNGEFKQLLKGDK